MATSNPYNRQPQFRDFTGRLPPAYAGADPGMVVQPGADPGYGMPNALLGNLNQTPGQEVGGYLNAGNPLSQGNPIQPWIDTLPFALKQWNTLTPEQRAMYEQAYRAHTGALSNDEIISGQRYPNWAEQYPGF